MSVSDLEEQIAIELRAIARTLDELRSLRADLTGREPTPREAAAAGAGVAEG